MLGLRLGNVGVMSKGQMLAKRLQCTLFGGALGFIVNHGSLQYLHFKIQYHKVREGLQLEKYLILISNYMVQLSWKGSLT